MDNDAAACNSANPPEPRLSKAELEVLRLAGLGLGTVEIATRLGIEIDHVRARLRAAMRKLEAGSKLELLLRAHRLGLLDLSES